MSLIKKSLTDQDWPGSLAHTGLEWENKSIFVSDWNHIFIDFPLLLSSHSKLLKATENNQHQKVKITPQKVLLDICGMLCTSLALTHSSFYLFLQSAFLQRLLKLPLVQPDTVRVSGLSNVFVCRVFI